MNATTITKTFTIAIVMHIAAAVTLAAVEKPDEIIVGISPFLTAVERTNNEAALNKLVLVNSQNGCQITFWDAWNLRVIANVQLPRLKYDSVAARATHAVSALGALKNWFADREDQVPPELRNSGVVKMPEFVQMLTAKQPSGVRCVVILASPFYESLAEPTFSMRREPVYPSDGHIGRSISDTPFGMAEMRGRLANTTIHWAYPGDNIWANESHRRAVIRFWSLWTAAGGGTLVVLSGDAQQVLIDATRGEKRSSDEFAVNPHDAELTMHAAVARSVPTRRPVTAHVVQESPQFIKPQPLSKPEIKSIPLPAPEPPPKPAAQLPTPRPVQTAAPSAPELPPKPTVQNSPPEPVLRTLDVTVVDRNNHPVVNLERADFDIHEDGIRQDIASFNRDRTPISIGLVIDTSGSIAAKLTRIEAAATSIIRQSQPNDEFFVMEFKAEATIIQDFTTNSAAVEKSLRRLRASGQTALLDAVKFGVEHANKWGKNDRKCIVVVTDGDERDSRCNPEELLQSLRTANVTVHCVGFPDGLNKGESTIRRGTAPVKPQQTESRARGLMDELARVSGGRAFYPRQIAELDGIAEAIAQELRTQYRLGYYANRAGSIGGWREVRVEIKPTQGRDGMNARTRAGYITGAP